jgi:hypothetical protein
MTASKWLAHKLPLNDAPQRLNAAVGPDFPKVLLRWLARREGV